MRLIICPQDNGLYLKTKWLVYDVIDVGAGIIRISRDASLLDDVVCSVCLLSKLL